MSNPFGNTSDVVMLLSRWLSVPHTMSDWCSCYREANSSRFPVERRLQQLTVIIFSLCSFRVVPSGLSLPSVPVISVVLAVCLFLFTWEYPSESEGLPGTSESGW